MKKKTNKNIEKSAEKRGSTSGSADFYTGAPEEKPLYHRHASSESLRVQQTGRHQAAAGRRKETVDPREQMALLAILRMGALILFLMISFFVLWKGIKLYEDRIWRETQVSTEGSSRVQEDALIREFDIQNQDAREMFAERVEQWKEADRLVRASDALLKRNNRERAIERCQAALRVDPYHMGALERLGGLYYEEESYDDAINSYVRLLGLDPTRSDLQKKLIRALDTRGDSKAVIYLVRWYFETNYYDVEVQRYLATALFKQKVYEEAIKEYARVLVDFPNDSHVLEFQATSYMAMERYEEALVPLLTLRKVDPENQRCYKLIIDCLAQQDNAEEVVQLLGLSAHLFGQNVVVGWVKDPLLDPVRKDRSFQVFADRVGGAEFRKWLEKVAGNMEGNQRKGIDPQLIKEKNDGFEAKLLQPRAGQK